MEPRRRVLIEDGIGGGGRDPGVIESGLEVSIDGAPYKGMSIHQC